MADGGYSEFSIAHDRMYTLEHLWLQVLDEDKDDGTTSIKTKFVVGVLPGYKVCTA